MCGTKSEDELLLSMRPAAASPTNAHLYLQINEAINILSKCNIKMCEKCIYDIKIYPVFCLFTSEIAVICARAIATRDLAAWQQPVVVATSEDVRVLEVHCWR